MSRQIFTVRLKCLFSGWLKTFLSALGQSAGPAGSQCDGSHQRHAPQLALGTEATSFAKTQPLLTRLSFSLFSLVLLVFIGLPALGQSSSSAAVNGIVQDATDARIPNASVKLINTDTGTESSSTTGKDGNFSIPSVLPGHYRLQIERDGFDTTQLTGITLNIGDNKNVIIRMKVGSSQQTVTVDASGLTINTTDASVSTVVDRQFVANMPLNGRSFQSLILLAPGVVTATPQNGANQGVTGEFSVNGQRADANNFTVDGVSANNSPYPYGYNTAGSAGGLPATTALGTTQALVSVDALQEFRIQTSTYSAQYGRQPGGQISLETRSGTNDWHGSGFDYLRNNVFDANNWFNDDTTPITQKPAERQNDFGGAVGGPLGVPKRYSGKNRTFFFLSYEGLRLMQPQSAAVSYVPSPQIRQTAPAALQPVLNAYPLPNCTTTMSPLCVAPTNGLLPSFWTAALPSSLDAISARLDERVASWLNLFFRFGSTQSSSETSATNYVRSVTTNTTNYTLGGDSSIGANVANQFRLNYSPATASAPVTLANYGGAVPSNLFALNNITSSNGVLAFYLEFPGYDGMIQTGSSSGKQHQWNLVDTLTRRQGNHSLSFGIDYRRTSVTTLALSPELLYFYTSAASVTANSPEAEVIIASPQYPEFTNFSAFAQDEWRVSRTVNLSLGLRWDVDPPPTVTAGPDSRTVNGNFSNPSSLTLAPTGTPLYNTTFYNFAPRIGVAAVLHSAPGRELILRTGGGVFFDTGQNSNTVFGNGESPGTGYRHVYPASTVNAFPYIAPISISPTASLTPPYPSIFMISQHLQLPYTFQWNVTLEQALGNAQSILIGYVGSNGRRLLDQNTYEFSGSDFSSIAVYQNGLSSSYNSLQVQYRRTLTRGLQALGSYTWAHALDFESQDSGFYPYQRGNSDFDVRSNFTTALSYDPSGPVGFRYAKVLLGGWGTDLRFTTRTGFPVTLSGNEFIDPTTGNAVYSGLNTIPNVPLYQNGPYAGGRRVNPAAFSLPTGMNLGDAPRNFVRGFGESEVNFSLRRELPLYERLHLQCRAEAFNVFNHPNFGYITPTYGNALFGQATKTLANSIGGLTSLYQQGGPRSMQFSLRVQF